MLLIPGVIASSYPKASGAFESIASATGTGSSGTITFSSIPSTYTSLQIRAIGRPTGAGTTATYIRLRLNSDTGANYRTHYLLGDGASALAGTTSTTSMEMWQLIRGGWGTSNDHSAMVIDIYDYASTTRNKTVRMFNGNEDNTNGFAAMNSGLWLSTSAITSIDIITSVGSWTTTSQFALYGIKGA